MITLLLLASVTPQIEACSKREGRVPPASTAACAVPMEPKASVREVMPVVSASGRKGVQAGSKDVGIGSSRPSENVKHGHAAEFGIEDATRQKPKIEQEPRGIWSTLRSMEAGSWADWASGIGSLAAALTAVVIASLDRRRFRNDQKRATEKSRQIAQTYNSYLMNLYERLHDMLTDIYECRKTDATAISTIIGHVKKAELMPDIDIETYVKFEELFRLCSEIQLAMIGGEWTQAVEQNCVDFLARCAEYLPAQDEVATSSVKLVDRPPRPAI